MLWYGWLQPVGIAVSSTPLESQEPGYTTDVGYARLEPSGEVSGRNSSIRDVTMPHFKFARLVLGVVLAAPPFQARAGFDAGILIQSSPKLEASSSHIVVGRLSAFHEWSGKANAYLAEIEVSRVEKGEGIPPGSRIFVRFSSPRSLEKIKSERIVPSCGDRKIDPLPGEWLRAYMKRGENFQFVADYPECFFEVGRRKASPAKPEAISFSLACAMGGLGILGGYLGGLLSPRRNSAVSHLPD
ncbi:hypothetical protein ACYOEI_14950 [Singulisphaera rosea]